MKTKLEDVTHLYKQYLVERTKLLADLETLVDKHGFDLIRLILADIADLKADHIRANWQDEELAAIYEDDAKRIRGAK